MEPNIYLPLLVIVAGILFLVLSFYAIATIADFVKGKHIHLVITGLFIGTLMLGHFYWRPIAIVATILLWGVALFLFLLDRYSSGKSS